MLSTYCDWLTLGTFSPSNGIIADIRVDGSRLRFFILEVNDFPEKENFFFGDSLSEGGFEQ